MPPKPKTGHKLTPEQRKARVERGQLRLAARKAERMERRTTLKTARSEKFTALQAEVEAAAKAKTKKTPAAVKAGGANG